MSATTLVSLLAVFVLFSCAGELRRLRRSHARTLSSLVRQQEDLAHELAVADSNLSLMKELLQAAEHRSEALAVEVAQLRGRTGSGLRRSSPTPS